MWSASLFIVILVYFSILNAFLNYLRISYNVIWSYHPFPHLPDPINILIYPTLLSFTYPAPAPLSPACAAHLLLDMKPALFMTAQSSYVNLPCCFQKLLFSSSHSSPVALIIILPHLLWWFQSHEGRRYTCPIQDCGPQSLCPPTSCGTLC